jgi:4-hydroxybenzoyl-CoA reductase subunit beta
LERGLTVHLDPFELHRPTTIDEAIGLADRLRGRFDFVAGGSDLLPNYKMHLNARPNLVALDDIAELRGRSPERIGAMERLADLERDAALAKTLPAVAAAVGEVATPLVRARATLGGNLMVETRCFFFNQSAPWRQSLGGCLKAEGDRCHVVPQKERCYATFSGDLAPALMVHGAEVEIAGPSGRRRFPLSEMYDSTGDGIQRHHLAAGELIVAVHLPPAGRGRRSTYRKLRVRPAFDFPELGLAGAARFDGERLVELVLAAGGLETYPRTFDALTGPLVGAPLTDEGIHSVAEALVRQVRPVHNTFLSPDYRRKMAGVFTRRVLASLRPSGTGGP